jgi:predicted  nucleic acid-binding Zn-ribbon protein
MTEIITDYLDAKQLADRLTALELHSTSELARLERERDEAREKVEQQRKEIVRLNGATSHAGGTPLKIALRERDEARNECDKLKQLLAADSERVDAYLGVCMERDEAREKLSAAWQSLRDSQDEVLRLTFENRELSQSIEGWENKWKCAIDMAARAELERDEALRCAKEYYVEFIRNASSDNKVSKPNPLNPFYKY